MRCPEVRKCSCLYTMYHINNNVYSCVLKVVRLQSDVQLSLSRESNKIAKRRKTKHKTDELIKWS